VILLQARALRQAGGARPSRASDERIDPRVCWPLLAVHAGALLVLWTGWTPSALLVALALFVARAFGLTAGYHRYFAHRAFRTSRAFQFALACLGASAAQLGPLWWAAHHRRHHRHSDTEHDVHSPRRGLLWAHLGWLLCRRYSATDLASIRDFARYPELRYLDRFPALPPLVLAAALWVLGGVELLAWGFFVSTVVLYHVTFAVNSLGHRFGQQRFASGDQSRNNLWIALATLGDGWHNNHHRFPRSARHGFGPREIDLTHAGLRLLETLGLVWDLVPIPAAAVEPTAALQPRRAQRAR
jgi:stearoyl-CoA desaturase (delta-9 desaturase)